MLAITYHGSAYNLVRPALAPLVQACASNVHTLEIRLDEHYSDFLFKHMISLSDLSLVIPISQPQICTSVLTRTPNLKNFHLCLLADDHMSGDLQGWKEIGHLDDWISPRLGNVQRHRRWTLRPIEGGSELSFEQMMLFRKTMLQVARKGWTGRGWASPDDFGESFEDAEYLSEPDDSVGSDSTGPPSTINPAIGNLRCSSRIVQGSNIVSKKRPGPLSEEGEEDDSIEEIDISEYRPKQSKRPKNTVKSNDFGSISEPEGNPLKQTPQRNKAQNRSRNSGKSKNRQGTPRSVGRNPIFNGRLLAPVGGGSTTTRSQAEAARNPPLPPPPPRRPAVATRDPQGPDLSSWEATFDFVKHAEVIAEWEASQKAADAKAQQAQQAAEASTVVKPPLQLRSSVPAADDPTNAAAEKRSISVRQNGAVDNDGEVIWVRLPAGSHCPAAEADEIGSADEFEVSRSEDSEELTSEEEYSGKRKLTKRKSKSHTVNSCTVTPDNLSIVNDNDDGEENRGNSAPPCFTDEPGPPQQTEDQVQVDQIPEDQSIEVLAYGFEALLQEMSGGQTFDVEKFAEQIGKKKAVKVGQSEEDLCKLFGLAGIGTYETRTNNPRNKFRTWWSFTKAAEEVKDMGLTTWQAACDDAYKTYMEGAKTKEEIAERMAPILEELEAMGASNDKHLTISSRFKSATSKLDALCRNVTQMNGDMVAAAVLLNLTDVGPKSAIFCGSDILPDILVAENINTKVLLRNVTTKVRAKTIDLATLVHPEVEQGTTQIVPQASVPKAGFPLVDARNKNIAGSHVAPKVEKKSKQAAAEVARQILKEQLTACGIPVNVNIKWKILVQELLRVGATLKGWTCYNNIPGHTFKGIAAISTKAWEAMLSSLQNKRAGVEFWSEADKALDTADEAYRQIVLVSGAYLNYEALVRVCDLNHSTQEPQNEQEPEQQENVEALPDTMYGRVQTPDLEPHPAPGIAQPSDHLEGFSPNQIDRFASSPALQSELGFQYRLHRHPEHDRPAPSGYQYAERRCMSSVDPDHPHPAPLLGNVKLDDFTITDSSTEAMDPGKRKLWRIDKHMQLPEYHAHRHDQSSSPGPASSSPAPFIRVPPSQRGLVPPRNAVSRRSEDGMMPSFTQRALIPHRRSVSQKPLENMDQPPFAQRSTSQQLGPPFSWVPPQSNQSSGQQVESNHIHYSLHPPRTNMDRRELALAKAANRRRPVIYDNGEGSSMQPARAGPSRKRYGDEQDDSDDVAPRKKKSRHGGY
ncbi:hypothetical protein C8J56DRAFT_1056667 [Mycena floridula]|nr:hypothetical protein C8J56DRAFT_1056667 [Mycena floridula]